MKTIDDLKLFLTAFISRMQENNQLNEEIILNTIQSFIVHNLKDDSQAGDLYLFALDLLEEQKKSSDIDKIQIAIITYKNEYSEYIEGVLSKRASTSRKNFIIEGKKLPTGESLKQFELVIMFIEDKQDNDPYEKLIRDIKQKDSHHSAQILCLSEKVKMSCLQGLYLAGADEVLPLPIDDILFASRLNAYVDINKQKHRLAQSKLEQEYLAHRLKRDKDKIKKIEAEVIALRSLKKLTRSMIQELKHNDIPLLRALHYVLKKSQSRFEEIGRDIYIDEDYLPILSQFESYLSNSLNEMLSLVQSVEQFGNFKIENEDTLRKRISLLENSIREFVQQGYIKPETGREIINVCKISENKNNIELF